MAPILLDGTTLTLDQFQEIVFENAAVELAPSAKKRIKSSRAVIDKLVQSGQAVYGVNTGFGILSQVRIDITQLTKLQENLIRSHCCGLGEAHSETESRAILLLRTQTLATGFCGVSLDLAEHLVTMLNRKIHAVIPKQGSVGASGDLAPLAHLASVVMGEGQAFLNGNPTPTAEVLSTAKLSKYLLGPKEGLSLINGTQQMTSLGALMILSADRLVSLADLISTVSLEGILGSTTALSPWIHHSRPYAGQIESAKLMSRSMEGSEIRDSHADCDRVQDPYSLRCAAQVHGAVRDLFSHVRNVVNIEMNSATDNPLVNPDTGEVVSQGNFHGQPIAFALDILGMGLSELSSISERRIVKLIDNRWSGLPNFLVQEEGLNSGFMVAQYAAAALASENRGYTFSASTDSIPTCNEKEDHVSMGPIAAKKAAMILANSERVLAIELLAACQALEFRKPLKPGKGPAALVEYVRQYVPPLQKDRYLHKDIELVAELIRSGAMTNYLEGKGF